MGLGEWVPYERNVHLARRRKWTRTRKRIKDLKAKKVRVVLVSVGYTLFSTYVHMVCHWTMPWNGHHQTVRELVVVSPLTAKDT